MGEDVYRWDEDAFKQWLQESLDVILRLKAKAILKPPKNSRRRKGQNLGHTPTSDYPQTPLRSSRIRPSSGQLERRPTPPASPYSYLPDCEDPPSPSPAPTVPRRPATRQPGSGRLPRVRTTRSTIRSFDVATSAVLETEMNQGLCRSGGEDGAQRMRKQVES
jgi:hypothetical protein